MTKNLEENPDIFYAMHVKNKSQIIKMEPTSQYRIIWIKHRLGLNEPG